MFGETTIFYIKIWNHPIDSQPFINGRPWGSKGVTIGSSHHRGPISSPSFSARLSPGFSDDLASVTLQFTFRRVVDSGEFIEKNQDLNRLCPKKLYELVELNQPI